MLAHDFAGSKATGNGWNNACASGTFFQAFKYLDVKEFVTCMDGNDHL